MRAVDLEADARSCGRSRTGSPRRRPAHRRSKPAEEDRGVVDGDRAASRCRRCRRARRTRPGSGRSVTNVSISPDTPVIRSPVMNCVRSTMCAPMSPERAGAGLVLAAAATISGASRVDEPVLQVLRAHVPDRRRSGPSATSCAGQRDRRHPAVGEADHGAHAARRGALGGRGHRLGLGDGVGQRLLAQHVLAGLERGDGDLGVGVARRADVDEVDVVARDHRAPVGLGRLPSPAARPRRRRRSASRPHDDGHRRAAAAGRRSAARCARPASGRRP